jgi:anti-sigma28 factor (negative regulator of flagellin synthesis)
MAPRWRGAATLTSEEPSCVNIDRTQSSYTRPVEQTGQVPPRARPKPDADAGTGAAPRDRVDISEGAREVVRMSETELAARLAKVRQLREQIDAGDYEVDPNGLARRIVDRGDV